METHYDTLNLTPEASIQDIKVAYRRLAKEYHPDSGNTGGDAARFLAVNEAYKALLNQHGPRVTPPPQREQTVNRPQPEREPEPAWRFEGVAENGPDTIYIIRVREDALIDGIKLTMPWKAEDACPKCLGEGHTLAPIFGGPHLRLMTCPKCKGTGLIVHDSSINLDLTPDMIRQRQVRVAGMGHYRPVEGRRGDLVIEINIGDYTHYSARMWAA
jgi:DnaJ-class molecular chaperone